MTKWEYLTAPILMHAAKQILDNFGADGWELVQIAPGMNPENLVGYFKRPVAADGHRRGAAGRARPVGARGGQAGRVVRPGRPVAATYVFTSGQLPMRSGELIATGKVGGEVTPEEAVACAQQCALNAIAAVKAEIGDLDLVKRIVKVVAFVASTPDFTGQPRVANGASELLGEVFGDAGVARPLGGRRTGAAARRPGRGRDPRRGLSVRVPLPPQLVEHAREFAEGRRRRPSRATRRRSCCCGAGRTRGPEVYLLRRQTSMAFAGGMCVFPGGGVDPRDFDASVAWAGPTPAEWAARLGTDEETGPGAGVRRGPRDLRGVRACCWPGRRPDDVVADTTGDDWEADRVGPRGARSCPSPTFLDRRGLVLRTDLLGVWSALVTPVFEPRRFRTWFFVAALPPGQRTRDVSTESSSVTWLPAAGAVRRGRRRRAR